MSTKLYEIMVVIYSKYTTSKLQQNVTEQKKK